jgi:hypothetical protein
MCRYKTLHGSIGLEKHRIHDITAGFSDVETHTRRLLKKREKNTCPIKVKVIFTLEQTAKAQRGSRGIALYFL